METLEARQARAPHLAPNGCGQEDFQDLPDTLFIAGGCQSVLALPRRSST
jgi:hypothetical protein